MTTYQQQSIIDKIQVSFGLDYDQAALLFLAWYAPASLNRKQQEQIASLLYTL